MSADGDEGRRNAEAGEPPVDRQGVDEMTAALLTASRLLVAISARSIAAVEETLTLPQFRMLVVLSSQGPSKLVALAEKLHVNPSTAMRMTDRLVAAGMVDRRASPHSGREVRIQLTETGREVVDTVTARRRDELAAIVARMTAEQRRSLVAALRAFTAAGAEPPATTPIPLGWA
ncbi:DNA-binding transcriptional regulator, MarR family [Actinomadura meyerae]|jgi:DNA-binding MarR family transcriptional regulator|uniref:DNA-binding transcriptional regulator, MarR family n=1 Tax=Actinomadura meyerae TaxID=240840 RepID=A0A239NAV0_9ACTN|nr:MarR family transcriptional regulator [Actinomadura meyerae]SNT52031.1 DNA-binding transcriptional regulator, MarR family [Actinomadura meyerae]